MTNISPDTQTTASGRCGCASHGGDSVEEHADRRQHSREDGCCGGSTERAGPAHEHAHPGHQHQPSKGGGCCGGSHAETVATGSGQPSRS
jgi:hypothetical protein